MPGAVVVLWTFFRQHHAVNFEKLDLLRRSHRAEAVFVASPVVWLPDCTVPRNWLIVLVLAGLSE